MCLVFCRSIPPCAFSPGFLLMYFASGSPLISFYLRLAAQGHLPQFCRQGCSLGGQRKAVVRNEFPYVQKAVLLSE